MGFIRSLQVEGASPQVQDVNPSEESEAVVCNAKVLVVDCAPGSENRRSVRRVPKVMRDADLPFVSADVVRGQDGKAGRKLWIVVNSVVLDVTDYQARHPGGRSIIEGFGGQDCTWQWYSFHNRDIWEEVARSMRIGRTEGIRNKHRPPRQWIGLRKFGFDFDS